MVISVGGKRVGIDEKKFSDPNINNFENYCIFSTWGSKNSMSQVCNFFYMYDLRIDSK